MTQEIGQGICNYFSITVQETFELEDEVYLQKGENKGTQEYGLLYRENGRYGNPVLIENSADEDLIDDLIAEAEENGVEVLLE